MDQVTKRTGGKITFERFYGASLAKPGDTARTVGEGTAQMGMVGPAYTPAFFPAWTVVEVIYLSPSPYVTQITAKELLKKNNVIAAEWDKVNLHPVTPLPAAPAIICTKKQVKTIENLKGQKIRGYGFIIEALNLTGAVGVAMALGEVYDALQRGVLDGISGIPYEYSVAGRYHEVAPYCTDPGFGVYGTGVLVMNKNVWNSLDKGLKDIIEEVNSEFPTYFTNVALEVAEWKRLLVGLAEGQILYDMPASEKARFADLIKKPIKKSWIEKTSGKGFDAAKLLAEYESMLSKNMPNDLYTNIFTLIDKAKKELGK